jgi:hypothetical protein
MLFMLLGQDRPDSAERRKAARPAHLARIRALVDAGRVALAGPLPASDRPDEARMTGSLIVAEFGSLDEARQWLAADPYVTDGVFAETTVLPFKRVLP